MDLPPHQLDIFDVMSAGGDACPRTVFSTTPQGGARYLRIHMALSFLTLAVPLERRGEQGQEEAKAARSSPLTGALDGAWLEDRLV
jgi:hypothetical protein